MTFGSLFSGCGGIDLAFKREGLVPAWQVEIDKTARSVLAKHWPGVPRHEDIHDCGKANLKRVDVVVGGFPCQDLSVAGKRAGLAGERSGLFWEMARIADELRPRFLVWENVPGLLSSDAGRDFGRVLRGLADIGYFGAWRVLDARFFGVPQRRRRVFGVFARGRAGVGRCAEILSLAQSLRRDSQEGTAAGQDVAGCLGGGSGSRGWADDTDRMTFVGSQTGKGYWTDGLGLVGTNSAHEAKDTDHILAFNWQNAGNAGYAFTEDGIGPLDSSQTKAIAIRTSQQSANGHGILEDATHTLNFIMGQAVCNGMAVRRLTPRECERLQGMPDDWTRWAATGKELADGPRYRLIGNSVAVPCVEWFARKLQAEDGAA